MSFLGGFLFQACHEGFMVLALYTDKREVEEAVLNDHFRFLFQRGENVSIH